MASLGRIGGAVAGGHDDGAAGRYDWRRQAQARGRGASRRRGGLPEALNGSGRLFDIPERFTAGGAEIPTAEEVAPWVEAIERLYDDEEYYQGHSERSLLAAQAWRPVALLPRFEAFLRG